MHQSIEWIHRKLLPVELRLVFLHLWAHIWVLQRIAFWELTIRCFYVEGLLLDLPLVEDRVMLGCAFEDADGIHEAVTVRLFLYSWHVNVVVLVAEVVQPTGWATGLDLHPDLEAFYVEDMIAFSWEPFDALQLTEVTEAYVAPTMTQIPISFQENNGANFAKILIEILKHFQSLSLLRFSHPHYWSPSSDASLHQKYTAFVKSVHKLLPTADYLLNTINCVLKNIEALLVMQAHLSNYFEQRLPRLHRALCNIMPRY